MSKKNLINHYEWLFIATYPNAYIYCDKRVENAETGDYKEIGRVLFNPLDISINDYNRKYKKVHELMRNDFKELKEKGEAIVSTTGQTVKVVPVELRVLSPDNFDIEMDKTYSNTEEAIEALKKFIKRYEKQGYYSHARLGRIPVNEIEAYCSILKA